MAAMLRAGAALALLAGLAPAPVPGQVPAQVPAQQQEPNPLVVLVYDPAGEPVEGASAVATARGVGELAALGAFGPTLSRPQAVAGRSDARGMLRLLPTDGRAPLGTAASGLVTTESGLGALLVDVMPGRAQRLQLQPMAAVTTAGQSEMLVVYSRVTLPSGATIVLPPLRGHIVHVPPGDHELWVLTADGWLWQRERVVSSQRLELAFDPPTRRVHRYWHDQAVHPEGRLDVPLFGDGDIAVFRGRACSATLFAKAIDGHLLRSGTFPEPDARGLVYWPPDTRELPTVRLLEVPVPRDADASLQEALALLERRADGSWSVLGLATARGFGAAPGAWWFDLPPPPPGDTWLLFVAHGYAPQARPWRGAPRFSFRFERGVPLHALVRDDHGLPVADVAVEYVPTDMDPATVEGRSDARGTARLGPVLAPGTLRVSDPRFANQQIALDLIPTDGVAVTVSAGSELHGTAKWSDGTVAHGVLVTLRDPNGLLRPAQRATTSGADGTFGFGGLPQDRPLVLFAQAQRDGRTWSGKLVGLRAGADGAIELVLRDEDPQLLPPAK